MNFTNVIFIIFAGISLILFSCRPPAGNKFETRAVWMSRFDFVQGKTAPEAQEFIRSAFKQLRKAGLNTVIFQVRGNADAFYQSKYEPWSNLLSDSLGKNPGWDPLGFALEEAHLQGLELHAWINTFPAWRSGEPAPAESVPLHPLRAHPEWVVCDSSGTPMNPEHGYITFSPGIPAVQDHIFNVVMDIVVNYDIDGIHFDYIRYPESSPEMGYSHDTISIRRFASEKDNPHRLTWDSFQRNQVNNFVTTAYNNIVSVKPWIKVSAAVIGHHYGAAWNGYHAVYQDARRWMADGKMDIIFLMTYQKIGHPTAPYDGALKQWQEMIHLGRLIIPGIATYRVDSQFRWGDIWDQIELVRRENFPGMIFFSAGSLLRGLQQIRQNYYVQPALSAPLPWKDNIPVFVPTELQSSVTEDSVVFKWRSSGDAFCFVLYDRLPIDQPAHIRAIIPGKNRLYHAVLRKTNQHFYLTAVNRAGVESDAVKFPDKFIADRR